VSEDNSIQVHFGRPIPLFPLEQVTLLPQQVLPLHIFEPRYRQMVERALDGAGQIAMAVFEGEQWKQEYHGRPAVRPVVCVGQIVQHEKLPDGRYNLLVQGVCRARILRELAASTERLYREVMLEPLGLPDDEDEPLLAPVRQNLAELLSEGPLTHLAAAEPLLEHLRNDEIPTRALLELVSFTVVSDAEKRYRLLAEPDVSARAGVILGELSALSKLIARGLEQHPESWPKGCSWN
jgi:Lon protease-like protein